MTKKSQENRTSMNITMLFLAKPLDKSMLVYHTSAYQLSALEKSKEIFERYHNGGKVWWNNLKVCLMKE